MTDDKESVKLNKVEVVMQKTMIRDGIQSFSEYAHISLSSPERSQTELQADAVVLLEKVRREK